MRPGETPVLRTWSADKSPPRDKNLSGKPKTGIRPTSQPITVITFNQSQLLSGLRQFESTFFRKTHYSLYYTHNYKLVIPENTIFAKNNNINGYKAVEVSLAGNAYKTFGFGGRITPKDNSEISYLTNINIPVDCGENEYLGRDFKASVQLFKIEGDTQIEVGEPVSCMVDESAKGILVPIYKFDLEPSSTYQVVLGADQFHLWSYDTQKPLHETSNGGLVLTYTTPTEIETLPRQEFGTSVPAENDEVETLSSLCVNFKLYEFEDTQYYPVFLNRVC